MEDLSNFLLGRNAERQTLTSRYSRATRLFHWLFAATIIYATVIGFSLDHIRPASLKHLLSNLNMSIATILISLFPLRVLARVYWKAPEIDNPDARMTKVANAVHYILYILIGLVLASGFLMVPKGYYFLGILWIPTPFDRGEVTEYLFQVHRYACIALAALVSLHILAVLKHHFVGKNPIIRRML